MLMLRFRWDTFKELSNFEKHGVDFHTASLAFNDPNRILARDERHSDFEERFYCVGKVSDRILTVRFVQRGDHVRIIGAGFWRKGRKLYEKENKS